MEPDEKKTENETDLKKIDEIIERSNLQSRILEKVLTELNNRSKLLESEEVKIPINNEK